MEIICAACGEPQDSLEELVDERCRRCLEEELMLDEEGEPLAVDWFMERVRKRGGWE